MGSNENNHCEEKIDREPEIIISLGNFKYSNTTIFQEKTTKFLGRTNELNRLKDHLIQGHKNNNFTGSILVAGFRGAGKTGFVNKVIKEYEKFLEKKYEKFCEKLKRGKKKLIKVGINLGSEKNIDSKTVLFNMVTLLKHRIKEKSGCPRFVVPFTNGIIQSLFLVFSLVFLYLFYIKSKELPDCSSGCYDFIYPQISIFLFLTFLVISAFKAFYSHSLKSLHALQKLQIDMYATSENSLQFGWRNIVAKNKITTIPLDNNQIESRLRVIIEKAAPYFEIIYIFDELDKLSGVSSAENKTNTTSFDIVKESELRKQQVDAVLGDIKNLITSSNAIYIFIAGRDMYDAYLSERGSSNSLYESLFNDHIYISSFLTDRSNGDVYYLDSIIEAFVVSNLIPVEATTTKKESTAQSDQTKDFTSLKLIDYSKYFVNIKEKQIMKECNDNELSTEERDVISKDLINNIYILKTFIHFLTLHSWGNCKRLITLFESFVRYNRTTKQHELYFKTKDMQRLILASHLYISFHHSLSRILMNADDKLVVSSFSVFHYILKYHSIGFSRGHILRMYETINIHSSPELTQIVDIILHNVLRNHIRKIRNSFYRYRFSFLYEQEIHFITTISDGESAVFNFSLNAMDAVKQHYRSLIADSQYTRTDAQYGNVALASIHVVVGNFHFWEQSYDEARIQFGIALDILEKESVSRNELDKIDVVVQQVEVLLKLGSVAERMGNFSSAASIYISAEEIANDCLKILYSNGVKNQDSKWDVLRQPMWAKKFLNLKRSAIHYDQHTYLDKSTSDVSRYRNAVLSFYMENFPDAYSGFMSVITPQKEYRDNERSFFLEGNAYLKAGFSLLLNCSDNLYKNFKKITIESKDQDQALIKILPILISKINETIQELSKENTSLENFEQNYGEEIVISNTDNTIMMGQAVGLIKKSATCFENGKLNVNAATAYLSIVIMWEALLEMLPWQQLDHSEVYSLIQRIGLNNAINPYDSEKNPNSEIIKKIRTNIAKLRVEKGPTNDCWVFDAQERAFQASRNDTGGAFSHFMKVALLKNACIKLSETPFSDHETLRGMIFDKKFLENYLYQHYSIFGQAIITSVYWEEMTSNTACEDANESIQPTTFENLVQGITGGKLLPYGIRHYSIMLWLKGRIYLSKLRKYSISDKILSKEILALSSSALINLYRSSQYVIKTHGETANMALPPLYIIYYSMWEVLFHLVSNYKKANPSLKYLKAVSIVREELDKYFDQLALKDVSTRILDLRDVSQLALAQLKIVEQMGDLNSRDRTSIIRKKYYLDDDYEDNIFNLDWCYSRFLAPAALVHKLIIESEMRWIKKDS